MMLYFFLVVIRKDFKHTEYLGHLSFASDSLQRQLLATVKGKRRAKSSLKNPISSAVH